MVKVGLRKRAKNIAKELLCSIGMPRLLLQIYKASGKSGLLIFRYHRVSSSADKKEYMSIPADAFEQQMIFIKNNFKIVPMAEGVKAMRGGDCDGMRASINFDDGYMDNYLHAFPVLKRHKIPATIFLTTDFIGKRHSFWWDEVFNRVSAWHADSEESADTLNMELVGRKEEEIKIFIESLKKDFSGPGTDKLCQMLGWDEIKEMSEHGISFGSHTKTHRNLCLLEDAEIREELAGSKNIIEENTGKRVEEFSYPFGKFDKKVWAMAIEAGYGCARTSLRGINDKYTDRYSLVSIDTGFVKKPCHLGMRIVSILLRETGRG